MRPPRTPTDKAPQTPAIYSLHWVHWVLKTTPIHRGMQPCPHKTPLSETLKHQRSPCPTSCR